MLSRKTEPAGLITRSERVTRFKKHLPFQNSMASQSNVPTSHKIVQLIEHINLEKNGKSQNNTPKNISPLNLEKASKLYNFSSQHHQIQSESLERKRVRTQTKNDQSIRKPKSTFLSRVKKNSISFSKQEILENSSKDQFRVQLIELRNSFTKVSQKRKRSLVFDQPENKPHNPYLPMRKNTRPLQQAYEDKVAKRTGYHLKKQLDDYLKFICSPADTVYGHPTNYDNMRNQGKKQSGEKFDIKTAYTTQNIFLMIYETLIRQLKSEQAGALSELCQFYFTLNTKGQLQTLIASSYLKGFSCKLRQLFAAQRSALYYVTILEQQSRLITAQIKQPMKKIIYELHLAYAVVIQIVLQAMEQSDDAANGIGYTFKILKSMCEVEKSTQSVIEDLRLIAKRVNMKSIFDVERQFQMVIEKAKDNSKVEQKITRIQMSLSWKYLKIPPVPFLPQTQKQMYTLVLDLDQTLIHYDQSHQLLKFRPGLMIFLQAVSKIYQLVLFTASQKQYADKIIKEIDPEKSFFQFRLYRQHMVFDSKKLLKDITKLGRDIRKIVIVDNIVDNFRNCLANGLVIDSWVGDRKDNALINIIPVLKNVVDKQVEDVRQYFKSQKMILTHIAEQNEESVSSIPLS